MPIINPSDQFDAEVEKVAADKAKSEGVSRATVGIQVVPTTTPTNIFSKAFLQYAGERAIKTAAQVALAGGIGTIGFGVADVAWPILLSTVGLSALASVLTSVVTITGRNISD